MKPDQERVRGLLTDTVTLLCKNGLQYSKELKVQGLLGITLDNDDVFVVHINEIFDGLVGGQVTAIQPGDSINSAIVAADSATQPTEREQITVKSRKSTPHKHGVPRTSSPMTLHGSSKRKASLKPPQMRIKKEEDDDDVVLLDNAKSEPNHTSEFVPTATDLSGDGDREAMRMSYGGATLSELDQDSPPAKRRAGESVNKSGDAFTEQSESGAPFITGIVHNNTDADILGNTSSLDGSQLSGVGQMEGQVGFDNAPGCSAWDASQVADGNGEDPTDPGSQDSIAANAGTVIASALDPAIFGMPAGTKFLVVKEGEESVLQVLEVANNDQSSQHAIVGAQDAAKHTRARKYGAGKSFICYFEGCSRSYYQHRDLIRHIRNKHMKSKKELQIREHKQRKIVEQLAGKDLEEDEMKGPGTIEEDDSADDIPGESPSSRQARKYTRRCDLIPSRKSARTPKRSAEVTAFLTPKPPKPSKTPKNPSKATEEEAPNAKSRRVKAELKPFPCKFKGCDNSYFHNRDLTRHMRRKHFQENFNPQDQVVDAFKCGYPKCPNTYYTHKDALRHFQKKHMFNQEGERTAFDSPMVIGTKRKMSKKTKNFICPEKGCGIPFLHKTRYLEHGLKIHNKHLPEIPNAKSVMERAGLKEEKEENEEEEEFNCEEEGCDARYDDIYTLLEHYKEDHGHVNAYIKEEDEEDAANNADLTAAEAIAQADSLAEHTTDGAVIGLAMETTDSPVTSSVVVGTAMLGPEDEGVQNVVMPFPIEVIPAIGEDMEQSVDTEDLMGTTQ